MSKQFVPLLSLLLLAGCSNQLAPEASSKADTLPAAAIVPVARSSIARRLRVAGQFIPYQDVDLHAKVSGYIRRINVDIGDRVHAGQTLAVLEVPELDAQLAGAKAEVRHTESEINRAKSEVTRAESTHAALHAAYTRLQQAADQRPGLVAQQELDDARAKDQNSEAQIEVAKAGVETARQQLGVANADNLRVQALSDYSIVTAPFNGVVTMRYADVGSLIQAGTASNTQSMPVVRVAQSDLLRLRMPVPESDVAFIKPGSQVRVNVAALKRSWSGKIVRFARALDMNTRTMTAEVDVPNPELTLTPGMFAETEIYLEQRGSALNVPAQAVIRDGEKAHLLIVSSGDRVENRPVVTGIEGDNRIEILSGVSRGDFTIVSGQSSYQPGQHVRPQPAAEVNP